MTYPRSPELALTVACCRWPRSLEREAAVRDAASAVIDWELFDQLVVRHRVTPLARDALMRAGIVLPAAVEERLSARAAECAVTALTLARESVRLQCAFQAAEIPLLILKGTPLGILAYGDPCMKESWDIDLLTSIEALPDAQFLLEKLGYQLNLPRRITSEQFGRFAHFGMEAAYRHRESGLTVELHWRVTRNRRLLPNVSVHSPVQIVPIAGAQLLTFDDDILFAFLCNHGTHHAWSRLKWLADLGAFIASRGPGSLERMYQAATHANTARAPAVSLLLCCRLLGMRLPPTLDHLRNGQNVRFLESTATYYIKAPSPPGPILPPLRLHLSHLFLASGSRYLAEELRNAWNSPIERARFGFAASLLRLPLWLARIPGRLAHHLFRRAIGAISG